MSRNGKREILETLLSFDSESLHPIVLKTRLNVLSCVRTRSNPSGMAAKMSK